MRPMRRPADAQLDRMRDRLLDGPGTTEPSLRRAALEGGALPDPLAALLEKVRLHAYKVTDDDVATARAAGWSDSQLFELIVAAAAGAGLHRRDTFERLLADRTTSAP
jgi:hypothetical protein